MLVRVALKPKFMSFLLKMLLYIRHVFSSTPLKIRIYIKTIYIIPFHTVVFFVAESHVNDFQDDITSKTVQI